MTTLAIPTVETANLRLRCPHWSDFDAFAAFRMSNRTEHLGGACTRTQAFDKLGEIIGHWHLRGYGRWMVADKATDAPLGVVGLFYPDDWPEPEIAWSVFEAAEGRGVAYEASVAARAYAYDTLGWSTAVSCVSTGNTRSVALAHRMGCTREEDFTTRDGMTLEVYRHPAPGGSGMNAVYDLIPTLETDRLILRAPKLDDLPAVTAFFASAQSHTVGGPRDDLGSAMSMNATFGVWALHGFGTWFIADRDSDAYLGRTGFIMAPGWEEPELGWAVMPEAEGKGIASEATRAARTYGAQHLGLNGVISYIRPTNTRSAALAKRLGAQLENTYDDWRGASCDVYRHPQEAI